MKKGKKIVVFGAGFATVVLTCVILYLTITETVTDLIISWVLGGNIFLIAAVLVWFALDMEKIDENIEDNNRYQDWVDKHGEIK